MPESLAAVGAYFAGSGSVAAATAAGVDVGLAAGGVGAGATGVSAAAGMGAGAAGAAAATGAVGGGVLGTAAQTAAGAAASAGVSSLLAPKPPKIPGAVAMPDAQAQEEARKRSVAEQMARRGRASTVLTDAPSGGTLGG